MSGQRRACDLSPGVLHRPIKMNGGKEREGVEGRGQLAQVPIGWQRRVEASGVLYIRYGPTLSKHASPGSRSII